MAQICPDHSRARRTFGVPRVAMLMRWLSLCLACVLAAESAAQTDGADPATPEPAGSPRDAARVDDAAGDDVEAEGVAEAAEGGAAPGEIRAGVYGDGEGVWLLRSNRTEGEITAWHHPAGQREVQRFVKAFDGLSGVALRHGVAAGREALWVVYEVEAGRPRPVQLLRRVERDPPLPPAYTTTMAAPIPAELPATPWRGAVRVTGVRGMAAGRHRAWALLDVEPIEPDRPADEAGGPVGERPIEPVAGQPLPADYGPAGLAMIASETGGWRQVALPADLDAQRSHWLLAASRGRPLPAVLSHDRADGAVMRVDWPTLPDGVAELSRVPRGEEPTPWAPTWRTERYPVGFAPDVAPVTVGGQIVLGAAEREGEALRVRLGLTRPQGWVELGEVVFESAPSGGWSLAPFGSDLAVVAGTHPERFQLAVMTLDGELRTPPTPPVIDEAPSETPPIPLPVLVLFTAALLLMLFWRRNPIAHRVALPSELRLAPLGTRALAGAIDLAPAVAVVMLLLQASPETMTVHWIGELRELDQMLAPGLAIVLYVIYGVVTEWLMGTSPGKRVLKLRVVALHGERATPKQIVIRNLLKVLDLLAWPLLVMPLIGAYRQRLGDLVARTLVVAPARPAEDEPPRDLDE